MTRYGILAVLMVMVAGPGTIRAQESARERARQALPPQVFLTVDELATAASEEGIPADALFNKALEGMAKRVPADRLLPALNQYAGDLRQARNAFGGVGGGPLFVAGADALRRGVRFEALRRLGEPLEDSPGPSPMAVLVLADLVEAGVPEDRALGVLREAMRMRTRDQQMLGIPGRVRQLMRQGQSAQDAADHVRRSLQRGRGGGVGPPVPPGSEPMPKGRRMGGRGGSGG